MHISSITLTYVAVVTFARTNDNYRGLIMKRAQGKSWRELLYTENRQLLHVLGVRAMQEYTDAFELDSSTR